MKFQNDSYRFGNDRSVLWRKTCIWGPVGLRCRFVFNCTSDLETSSRGSVLSIGLGIDVPEPAPVAPLIADSR